MSMMKGFSNAFRIPGLRKKIFITLGLVIVCRLISQVPTPGVNWAALSGLMARIREMSSSSTAGSVFGWFETFTGGGLSQCAVGTLSIWPYISAQIVIQLLSSVIPSLEKLKKEGENGRQQLAQITRYLTIGLCVFQAWGISTLLLHPEMLGQNVAAMLGSEKLVASANPFMFSVLTVICMTAASLFVMWLADQITTFGVGNGASLIIMINITSRLPTALHYVWDTYFTGRVGENGHSYPELAILVAFFLVVVMGTVMLTQGVRKVAIHSTRRSVAGGNTYGMQQTFMPLRVNYAGVMPIIFAQPIIQILGWVLTHVSKDGGMIYGFGERLSQMQGPAYLVIYAILILFFTFFWVATQFNAVDISENLKKEGSYVPGIRPGRATAEYLDDAMTKITLIGGSGLLLIALVPMILTSTLVDNTAQGWAAAGFFGGTSLLIIVGVALDTLRIMESHLLVRKYEGFLSHGSLHGRGGV